jgi:hypothetical protein
MIPYVVIGALAAWLLTENEDKDVTQKNGIDRPTGGNVSELSPRRAESDRNGGVNENDSNHPGSKPGDNRSSKPDSDDPGPSQDEPVIKDEKDESIS